MAAIREKIRLVSTARKEDGSKTGAFYTTTVNRRARASTGQGKLERKKYDWVVRKHVIFKEEKIK